MDLKRKLSRLTGVGPSPGGPGRGPLPAAIARHEAETLAATEAVEAGASAATAGETRPEPALPGEAAPTPEETGRAGRMSRQLSTLDVGAATGRAPGSGLPLAPRPSAARARKSALPAQAVETAHGTLFMAETLYRADHHHGRAPLRRALEAESPLVAKLALDPSLSDVDLGGMLLLDTETTGLAGGTGTLPFVVGLGWFEAGRLRLSQLLLPGPGQEGPLLRFVAERLEKATCVVTYNGKTFDWPLLKARFVMNRLAVPEARPHLDLLHCARRIFRHRPGGARLVQFESEVLGHHRIGDIPGAEIPELYFRYLRTGDGGLLQPVVTHNADDIVLLAALLGELSHQFRNVRADDPRDSLGFASVAARAGDPERALAFAQEVLLKGAPGALQAEALVLSAGLWRRRGQEVDAVEALERALRLAPASRKPELHLTLAKLLEHRFGDPLRALEHARQTLAVEGELAHRQRLARLERRLVGKADRADAPRLPLQFG